MAKGDIDDIVEVPTLNDEVQNSIQTNEEVKENTSNVEKPALAKPSENVVSDDIANLNKEESFPQESKQVEVSDTVIDTGNILQEVSISDIPEVDSSNLGSVEVETQTVNLNPEVKPIENPILPDAEIGEINPDLLGKKYEEEEKINNEKQELKKQQDAEKARIEMEKLQSLPPEEKPDLLKTYDKPEEEVPSKKEKKKKEKKERKPLPVKRILIILIIIVAIILIGLLIWFFLGSGSTTTSNYIDPITEYLEGYENNESEKILSSYVPCMAESDTIKDSVNDIVYTRSQYTNLTLTWEEDRTEVVNSDDQSSIDEIITGACYTEEDIEEYMQVYINETITVNDSDEEEVTELTPRFWLVKIDSIWYIAYID